MSSSLRRSHAIDSRSYASDHALWDGAVYLVYRIIDIKHLLEDDKSTCFAFRHIQKALGDEWNI